MIVRTFRIDGNQRYGWTKNQRSLFVSRTRPRSLTLQELMSKHLVLSFKPQLRLEWRGQDGQNETEQPPFRQLRRFHHVINSDKVFGTHRQRKLESGADVPRPRQ